MYGTEVTAIEMCKIFNFDNFQMVLDGWLTMNRSTTLTDFQLDA
jgi:hypothetical protein